MLHYNKFTNKIKVIKITIVVYSNIFDLGFVNNKGCWLQVHSLHPQESQNDSLT